MKKAIFMINVSKIVQSFQISNEFQLNEGMTLSLKFGIIILTHNKSGLTISGQAWGSLLVLIVLDWCLLV